MADKLRDVFPIPVDFSVGEQPTSEKFTGWAVQTNAGLQMLEMSVGNVWGDQANFGGGIFFDPGRFNSNDAGAAATPPARPPMIANLARLIGPASALNPMRESVETVILVQLVLSDVPEGVTEFILPYPALRLGTAGGFPATEYVVDDSYSFVSPQGTIRGILETISTAAGDGVFDNWVASKALVLLTGDYTIDLHGRVYTFDPTSDYTVQMPIGVDTAGVYEYETTVFSDSYQQASMNVIPDPEETTAFKLCTVTRTGTTAFDVELPLVRVLPRKRVDGAAPFRPGHPDSEDGVRGGYPGGYDSSIGRSVYRPWLPRGIQHLADGDQIPDGFIYLWDTATNDTVGGVRVDGLTYKMGPNEYTIRVTGVDLDGIPDPISSFNSSRYRVITVGCTITESIADIRWRHDRHDHSDPFGCAPIQHSTVSGSLISPIEVDSVWSITVFGAPSTIEGNNHPQYLSRYGYVPGFADAIQSDNAMLGNLFMAADRVDYTTAFNYQCAIDDDSRGIIFGNGTNGPKLYYDGSTEPTYGYSSLRVTGHVSWGNFSVDNFIYTGDRTGDYIRITADRMQFFQSGSAVHDADIQQKASVFDISTSGTMDMQIWSSGGLFQFVTDTWTGGGHTVDLIATTGVFDITSTTADLQLTATATDICLDTVVGDVNLSSATGDINLLSANDISITSENIINFTTEDSNIKMLAGNTIAGQDIEILSVGGTLVLGTSDPAAQEAITLEKAGNYIEMVAGTYVSIDSQIVRRQWQSAAIGSPSIGDINTAFPTTSSGDTLFVHNTDDGNEYLIVKYGAFWYYLQFALAS